MNSDSAQAVARGSLRWYWNRMRVMNPLELPYRAVTAAGSMKDKTLERLGMLTPTPRKTCVFPQPWLPCATELPALDPEPYLREADAIAAGQIACVDGGSIELGHPSDWSAAVRTTPLTPRLDDVRFQMELHRHGHLVRLAQAWRLSGNEKYLMALLEQLESWLAQCLYPRGVAWSSALDAGLRLLNWSIVWQLVRAGQDESFVPEALGKRWLASVYVHARFVRQNRSRYSSANNHLLGELIGLIAAEATWPLWPDVQRWGVAARREFAVEALKQTHEDGVNREQASWYQSFVFELLATFVRIERAGGRHIDPRVLSRMNSMARFVAAMRDSGGHLSHHGDADHARALCVDPGPCEPYGRLIALAVDLGVAPELAPLIDSASAVSPWLLGGTPTPAGTSLAQRQAARSLLPRGFPQGGYHLLGSHFGEPDEVLMTMDTGALGYLSIAAHGHADALSLRLSVGGQPVLVDRGTYAYNAQPGWRHFFRSTLAHNTVCVDDTDQSAYGGPFLWTRHAAAHLDSFTSDETSGHVTAWHDGYGALPRPLVHRRRVEWRGAAQRFVVSDALQTNGPHKVAIAWHFDPQCELEVIDDVVQVRAPGALLRLRMADTAHTGRWQLHRGDADSKLGWHSPGFGVRIPAPSLVWRTRISGTTTLSTQIEIQFNQGRT
ncbi:MAG: alginate lyase family protein [Rhizobacter sp.]